MSMIIIVDTLYSLREAQSGGTELCVSHQGQWRCATQTPVPLRGGVGDGSHATIPLAVQIPVVTFRAETCCLVTASDLQRRLDAACPRSPLVTFLADDWLPCDDM
jgi:hypothetical protein